MSVEGPGSDEEPRRDAGEGPRKKASGKKASGKKASAKKAGQKKAGQKKAGGKKAGQKKAGGKKAGQKKAESRKAPAKKATGRKQSGKKTAAAKGGSRKAAAASASRGAGLPAPGSVERPWLPSYSAGVPESYDYPVVPLTRLLDDAASDFPQATAMEFLGAAWNYRQLREHVDAFATALRRLGVQQGDRVSVLLPNCPQHVVALFAALRLGAVVVEHDVFANAERLGRELTDADPKVLVCLDSLHGGLEGQISELRGLAHVVVTALREMMPLSRRATSALRPGTGFGMAPSTAQGSRLGRMVPDAVRSKRSAASPDTARQPQRFSELLRRTPAMVGQAELEPADDPAVVLYPADGDGRNGVTLTHSQLVTNAVQIRLWLRDVQAGGEKVLCAVPFFRAYGLTAGLATGVLAAASLTLLPRFEAGLALGVISRRRPTIFPGTPGMYVALGEDTGVRRADVTSLRACLSATTALATDVAEEFERRSGCRVLQAWAPSDASPLTHADPVDGPGKAGSIGLPLPDTVCALADGGGSSGSADGEAAGRLAVAGPQLPSGERQGDGWVLTDEEAEIDEDGYVILASRR